MPTGHLGQWGQAVHEPSGRLLDQTDVPQAERVTLEVVTLSGRAAAVELRLRGDGVEIWHHRALSAIFDRSALRKWLGDPAFPLASDGVSFSLDRMIDSQGRVAISLPDVRVWALSPTEMEALKLRI